MLTNLVTTTSAALTDGDRPTLRIAARTAHVAEESLPTTAVRITQEVSGCHAQLRHTLETVRATLAGLDQACESAIGAQQAETAGLIDRLVQNAATEASTIAAQMREQAQNELSQLQQGSMILQMTVEKLQAGLDDEQDNVKRLSAQLELEAAARLRAEMDRDEQQRQCHDGIAAAQAQIEALRAIVEAQKAELCSALQQLEAAAAERSKLTNTFRLVQRALALNPLGSIADATEADRGDAPRRAEPDTHQRPAELDVPPEPGKVVHPVADPHSAVIAAPVEAVEDVGRVLAQIEVMYLQDVESGRSGIELADRLSASIRHARSVIVSRWRLEAFDPQELFEYHMGLLLGREAATSFGRHLSIAAYSARIPDAPSAPEASGAALEGNG